MENLEVFVEELGDFALGPPALPTDKFNRKLQKIVDKMYLGQITPEYAAEMIQREGERVMEELRGKDISGAVMYVYPSIIFSLLVLFGFILYQRSRSLSRERAFHVSSKRGENVSGFLMLLPWLIGFLLFMLGPVIAAFCFSFTEWDLVGKPRWIGAWNFKEMFTRDETFISSLSATFIYVVSAVLITVVAALLAAVLVHRKVRLRSGFRTIYYLPSLVAGVALCFVFAWMYNARYGVVNTILGFVGIEGPQWLFSKGWALVAIISINLFYIGGNMLIFLAALQNVPHQYYEAAEIDGASATRQFFHITLPRITPAILFCVVIGTIVAFQVFTEPYVITDGGPDDATNFYILHLYNKAFKDLEMGYASALAVILFMIIFVITYIQLRVSRRWVYYET